MQVNRKYKLLKMGFQVQVFENEPRICETCDVMSMHFMCPAFRNA